MKRFFLFCSFGWMFFNAASLSAVASGNDGQPGWRPEFTEIAVTLDPQQGLLKGDARLTLVRSNSDTGGISLDLNRDLTLLSVTDGSGRELSFQRSDARVTVRGPGEAGQADTVFLCMHYEGSFTDRVLNAWVGPQISYALYPSRWYPEVSGPVRRSKGKLIFHVPGNWIVASVGRMMEEQTLEDGKRVVFQIDVPVEFSFAAAPFVSLRSEVEGSDLGIYLLHGDEKKARFYLENCQKIIGFFKDYFGIFPYESHSIIEIPTEYKGNEGGFSYQSLTFYTPYIFVDNAFPAPTFAHEIGHLWGGNYIRGPEGPVINEGLAQMSMGLYLEHVLGEKAFRSLLKNGAVGWQFWQSARMYLNFISPPDPGKKSSGWLHGQDMELGIYVPERYMTSHTLANSKGFFVYFMLRDLVGPRAFQEGLRGIMAQFPWSTAVTLEDLRHEFEKTGGRELKWFFDQWFFRKGAPEFSLSYNARTEGVNCRVQGLVDQVREVYRVNADVVFVKGETRETRNIVIPAGETPFSFVLPFEPDTVLFDPDYKILRWTEEFKN